MNLAVTLRNLFSKSQRIAGGEAGGLRIVTRGGDPDFARGAYEPPIQQLLTYVYDIDCGARVGAAGRVYAFEPVPQSAAAIEQSARPNRFDTICVFAEAAGPVSGHDELLLARHIGGAALSTAAAPPDMTGRISVVVNTIDDAIRIRGLRGPSFVKIEVEGAEMDVLQGMSETLSAHRPQVIYELDDARREGLQRKARAIASFMVSMDYG
ncbi:FkbM family methyltransferase [Mesorhizobium temperatum]|uniref:FkbM family methyltransferase n=1 Tax=Mesorhizobium temperatum TaxID=241416 RepID=UPI001FD9BAC9|nr:FkbM family methyltransferase [Mesorhizobium temperatum]